MTPDALLGGFDDPAIQSARAFRALLQAMARPGTIWPVEGAAPPAPLSIAAGLVLLTLADGTTPVHLAGDADCQMVRDWTRFHTAAPIVRAPDAVFAVGRWPDLQPVDRFQIGLPDYPDRSVTLIIEMDDLRPLGPRLSGPGIKDNIRLSLPEIAAFRANRALFPLGFDAYLTCGAHVAGLPRSTIVEDI
jgi:alpha-D-ribose 1-methylphosphonate 5-triphosphate synthase subunit PhnH